MLYKKQGIPEEGEYLICTVKKILPHSVFVDLDEYNNVEAMIHISEISPGRIRNIRDFVREGRKLVCKVLRVNKEKKQIDLSLRRVPLSERKKKNESQKQEQRAEKILEAVAHKTKTTLEAVYKEFGDSLMEQHGSLNTFFQEFTAGNTTLEEAKVPKKYQKALEETIKEKIKPVTLKVEAVLSLTSEAQNGIELIKNALKESEKLANEKKYELEISYVGAPRYRLVLKTTDYKTGEKEMQEVTNKAIMTIKKEGGQGEVMEK